MRQHHNMQGLDQKGILSDYRAREQRSASRLNMGERGLQ